MKFSTMISKYTILGRIPSKELVFDIKIRQNRFCCCWLSIYKEETPVILKLNFKSTRIGEPPCGQLNPRNNFTYIILQKLYAELLELTGPTDYFHLGGDEVNLECWSQYFNDTDMRGLWCDFLLQAYQRYVVVLSLWGEKMPRGQWRNGCRGREDTAGRRRRRIVG